MSVSVMANSDKYTIQMKDAEFHGEDPVLMRELRRRMPAVSDSDDLNSVLPMRDDEHDHERPDGSTSASVGLQEAREALFHQLSEVTRSSDPPPVLDGHSNNQTNIERQLRNRNNKAYKNQASDEVIKEFSIKMIEQAIYSVQYRLNEANSYIIGKYEKNVQFRIGYIFKQLEQWIYEMEVLYSYITNEKRKNLKEYNVWKNLIYYSHLVKKNFDITYTIYHLLKLHTDLVELVQKMKKKGPGEEGYQKIDARDIDLNDPAMASYLQDMMGEDQN